jgi:hypothetical protein
MNNNNITSFLIYSEQYGLVRLVHTIKELMEVMDIVNWAKVEVWKFGQCQNILKAYHSKEEVIKYANFYFYLVR